MAAEDASEHSADSEGECAEILEAAHVDGVVVLVLVVGVKVCDGCYRCRSA